MKKLFKTLAVTVALTTMAAGCSSNSASTSGATGGKVTLSLYSTVTNESDQKTMTDIIQKFEKANPNIIIKYNYPAGQYEGILRVKMAANDMPDLFDTHGWAKKRYGNYVEDLSKMDWVKDLDPAMKPILEDSKGKVYAFPLNQAKDGITYNATLLKKYGIQPPTTFDEFMTALQEIKKKSNGQVTPLWFAGSDKSQIAQYFDQFLTPLLTTDKTHDYSQQLTNGNFDWSKYTYLTEKFKEMKDQGLLNADVLTAQVQQLPQLMAQNKIAFIMAGSALGPTVKKLNPTIQLGTMPMPVIYKGDQPVWIGGERFTMAVWKDSKHKPEAEKFIEFLAQPDIVKEFSEGTASPAGLTNSNPQIYFSSDYAKYKDNRVEPYFDRLYLPSGMWDVMGSTGQQLVAGTLTPDQASQKMGEEFKRLSSQKK